MRLFDGNFRLLAILGTAAFFLSACAQTGGTAPPNDVPYKLAVTNHLAESKSTLTERGILNRCTINHPAVPRSMPAPEIVHDVNSRTFMDPVNNMAGYTIKNASDYYFLGNRAAGSRAISGMLTWSNADAHREVILPQGETNISTARWGSYVVMLSFLNSLFLLDDHPDLTAEREAAIWGWLDRSFERAKLDSTSEPTGAQRTSNHNARRSLLLLLYGVHKNDQSMVNKSVNFANRSFDNMEDYGIKTDAARASWALNYINFGIDSLVMHTAYMQLVDPNYRAKNQGNLVKLQASADFLFRETAQPDEIHQYASAGKGGVNRADGYDGKQDIWYLNDDAGGLAHYAWVDADVIPVNPRRSLRAMKHSETGGLVTCWFP